jgi:hypothetical protein
MRPIVHARFTRANAPTEEEGKRIVRKMTRVHFAAQPDWHGYRGMMERIDTDLAERASRN